MALRNIKLTICYDGSFYHGWQMQPGLPTIQGFVTEAIEKLTGRRVEVNGASRTDAGVSALGQAANILIDSPIPTENFAKAITEKLPCDIAVTEAVEVDSSFDAATSAKSKLYRYTIFTGPDRPVLEIRHCWHRVGELDVGQMAKAAQLFVGKKDFKSFASAADRRHSSVRTILRCDVNSSCEKAIQKPATDYTDIHCGPYENDWIYVDVEGDGFLYNMVRNIVGTVVEIGRGRWKPEKINEILEAKDRAAAGPIAPAAGLCLMWIEY